MLARNQAAVATAKVFSAAYPGATKVFSVVFEEYKGRATGGRDYLFPVRRGGQLAPEPDLNPWDHGKPLRGSIVP